MTESDGLRRIGRLDGLKAGDWYMTVDGNRYRVAAPPDRNGTTRVLVNQGTGSLIIHMDPGMFDHGLRPRPATPHKSGLWADREGSLWIATRDRTGILHLERVRHGEDDWVQPGLRLTRVEDDQTLDAYAPYRAYAPKGEKPGRRA